MPSGWMIVVYANVAVAWLLLVLIWLYGTDEPALRVMLRATADTSAVLFGATFVASSLRRLSRAPWTAWLLKNRRYVGVSFGVSHAYHLLLILALARVMAEPYEPFLISFGGLGYGFVAAMVATSFDRTTEWLDRRRWRQLHVTGSYYVWFVFAYTYASPVAGAGGPLLAPRQALLLGGFLAALGLRLWVRRRTRQPVRDGVAG